MAKLKEKAKRFLEKNKNAILFGIGCGTATACGLYLTKVYCKGYMDGAFVGFHETINWFDKTFPEQSHCKELYEQYAKMYPEKIIYRKI